MFHAAIKKLLHRWDIVSRVSEAKQTLKTEILQLPALLQCKEKNTRTENESIFINANDELT